MSSPVNLLLLALWLIFFGYWALSARQTNQTERAEIPTSRLIHLVVLTLSLLLVLTDLFRIGLLGQRFLPESSLLTALGLLLTAVSIGFAILARRQLGRYWSGTITIKTDHKLIRGGPYSLSRHPIYTGIIFAILGTAIALGEWRGLLAFALALVAYARKIPLEERWLSGEFGAEYEDYRHQVKALIPFIF